VIPEFFVGRLFLLAERYASWNGCPLLQVALRTAFDIIAGHPSLIIRVK
jgi:hypothetical protein